MQQPAVPQVEVEVVLVHGTFARAAEWIDPDKSAFCDRLRRALSPEVLPNFSSLLWSGANSHRHRLEAGQKLSERLRFLQESGAKVFAVGHSHGGAVVAHALGNLGKDAERICGSAFLATPFLRLAQRTASVAVCKWIEYLLYTILPVLTMLIVGPLVSYVLTYLGVEHSAMLSIISGLMSAIAIPLFLTEQIWYRRGPASFILNARNMLPWFAFWLVTISGYAALTLIQKDHYLLQFIAFIGTVAIAAGIYLLLRRQIPEIKLHGADVQSTQVKNSSHRYQELP